MEHIKQNDSGLYIPIQKIGCFYRSCGLIAEYKTRKQLTVEQLNNGWDDCKKMGDINREDDVVDSAKIISYFLHRLGDSGEYIEIGTIKNGLPGYYGWVTADMKKNHERFFIQKIRQNGPSIYHFRVVDEDGYLIEDPHRPDINVVSVVHSIIYYYREAK